MTRRGSVLGVGSDRSRGVGRRESKCNRRCLTETWRRSFSLSSRSTAGATWRPPNPHVRTSGSGASASTALSADEPVPDWIITAEIMRAWDGRTWIVYASRLCDSCGREDVACVSGLPAESDPRIMLMRAVSKLDERELRHEPHCPGVGR